MDSTLRADDGAQTPFHGNDGRPYPRRSHRKRSHSMNVNPSFSRHSSVASDLAPPPRKKMSRQSSSMSSSSSIRKHRKRNHRHQAPSAPSVRSDPSDPDPPVAKKLSSAGKKSIAALSGLAGLLVGVVPVAGELYLKHKEHQHERQREERKEATYGRAMEAREQKKMDLELQALEEEKTYQREKHRLELLEMQTELQKKMPRPALRKEVKWEDQQQSLRPSVEYRPVFLSANDGQSRGLSDVQQPRALLRRSESMCMDLDCACTNPTQGPLARRTRSPTPTNRELDLYIPPQNTNLPTGPAGTDLLPPSPQPSRRHRRKNPSHDALIPVSKQAIHAGAVGFVAGAATAFRLRKRHRVSVGEKGMRIGASAATAALASASVQNGERYEERHRLRDVALPVIAGIGVERILWDK
jgi:hypothetical protein